MTIKAIKAGDADETHVVVAIAEPGLRSRVNAALGEIRFLHADAPERASAILSDRVSDSFADPDLPRIFFGDSTDIAFALRHGASGALRPSFTAEQLRAAIEAVAAGLMCADVKELDQPTGRLRPAGRAMADEAEPPSQPLTARESEVLALMTTGASNKQIARALAISVHTAKFHVAAVIAKLGATGRTDAVARSLHAGRDMI